MARSRLDLSANETRTLILAGAGALLLVWLAGRAAGAAAGVIGQAADVAGGLVTGNNAITQSSARPDAYAGKGIFGTLGAGADIASGGALSSFGSWLGTSLFDITHPGQ